MESLTASNLPSPGLWSAPQLEMTKLCELSGMASGVQRLTCCALCERVHSSRGRAHEIFRRKCPSQDVAQAPQRVHRLLHHTSRCDASLGLVQAPAPCLRQHARHLLGLPGCLDAPTGGQCSNSNIWITRKRSHNATSLENQSRQDATLTQVQAQLQKERAPGLRGYQRRPASGAARRQPAGRVRRAPAAPALAHMCRAG